MQQEPDDTVENNRMLIESASAVVPDDGSLDRIRAARFQAPGFSREVWTTLTDMGWLGLRVGEAAGGLGLGVREGLALSRVLGAGLVPEPYLPNLLALSLMEAAKVGDRIEAVMGGDVIIVPAWQSAPNVMDLTGGVVVTGGRLNSAKIAVAAGADLFAVTTPDGVALVPCDAEGLTINPLQMQDGTFRSELQFDAIPCETHPCASMQGCLYEAMLLHAGFLQGTAERAFDITLEYLRTRTQFDVPIGSFQALQHRATKIKVQLELARAAIDAAALAFDQGQAGDLLQMAVLRARARAGVLARLVAREAVQMHGAIGYTDEADVGLYVRKLMVEAGQFAPEYHLRAQFMTLREAAA
jgi:alkylation response protein AidB-like acyl-CoA dehydrogenase